MGKSVVGIFAIALLQIAFLMYTAVDGVLSALINEVALPMVSEHDIARVDDIPEFGVRSYERTENGRSAAFTATRRPRPQAGRRGYRTTFKSIGSIVSTRIIQTGPGIPSGYSMVLVDYSPDVMINGKPKEIRFR